MNSKSVLMILSIVSTFSVIFVFFTFDSLDRSKDQISFVGSIDNQNDDHHNHDKISEMESKIKKSRNKLEQIDDLLLSLPNSKGLNGSRLIHPNQIKSIINIEINPKCNRLYGSDLIVVILVFTRANSFHRRQIIRQTWGSQVKKISSVKMFFVIGKTKNANVSFQNQVVNENNRFKDLIQFDFIDDYYNLTLKSLAMLRWSMTNCPLVKFVQKVDDDFVVNIENLKSFCNEHDHDTHVIWGHVGGRRAWVFR